MLAFSFSGTDDADAVTVFKHEPRFDVRRTPWQMGMLTELFRRMKGVHQSLHPTHGVAALGPLAAEMTAGHDRAATPSRERGIAAALAGRAGLDLVCLELGEGVRPDRDELPAAHLVAPDRGAALHALAPRPAAPLESRNGRLTSIAVVCTGIGGGAAGDQVARAGNPAEGLLQARDPPRLAPDRRSAGAPALMGPDARTGRWATPLALTRHGGRAHRACSGLARENLRTASIPGTARSRPACSGEARMRGSASRQRVCRAKVAPGRN